MNTVRRARISGGRVGSKLISLKAVIALGERSLSMFCSRSVTAANPFLVSLVLINGAFNTENAVLKMASDGTVSFG